MQSRQPDQPRPDPRLEESACELVSYSEQVIIGEMRDMAPGIPNQDIIMWVSMGAIVDRTTDRLGASDMAVVEFRKLMVDAAKTMETSGEALGSKSALKHTQIRSYEGVHSKETDWKTLCRN